MFSPRENRVIKIVGNKKTTVKKIVEELFKDGEISKPFDAQISVANTIRRIIEKCDYHKCDWNLHKSYHAGTMFITKVKR
jgi:hypothetical protein